MKKIYLLMISIFIFTGCNSGNDEPSISSIRILDTKDHDSYIEYTQPANGSWDGPETSVKIEINGKNFDSSVDVGICYHSNGTCYGGGNGKIESYSPNKVIMISDENWGIGNFPKKYSVIVGQECYNDYCSDVSKPFFVY